MEKEYSNKYISVEKSNWWFLARRNMILLLARKFPVTSRILEAGCSGGMLIQRLLKEGYRDVIGIDISQKAINSCIRRGLDRKRVILADATATPFDSQSFDLLIASDVLEHIEDETCALNEWNRVLKPGGHAIIFVPAFNFLTSEHDKLNHHFRRYSQSRLKALLKKTGFKVLRGSYWNFLVFLPTAAFRIAMGKINGQRTNPKDQLVEPGNFFNQALFGLLRLENKLLSKGMNFPFGVSVFCIAQKKGEAA